jgi:hypothetical protein
VTCEALRRDAAGLAALPPGDPEREAASAHARGCPGCAAALREGERLVALLDALPPEPAPSAAALRRAAAPVLAELPSRRAGFALPAAAVLTAAVIALSARGHSREPADWIAAAVLALAAGGSAALIHRGWIIAALAGAASLAAALLLGAPGALDLSEGLRCAATELAAAALPLVAALALARHGGVAPGPAPLAAAAASGALAGQAALEVACHAGHASPHLLAFHVGAVLAAAAIGAIAGARFVYAPTRAP